MAEQRLRLDSRLGHTAGPAPADQMEGLSTDGTPLALQHDPLLASLPPPPPTPEPGFDWEQALAALYGAWTDAVPLLQWFFLLYFIALHGGYLLLNLAAMFMLRSTLREQDAMATSRNEARNERPISIILPAGKDAAVAIPSIKTLLQLDYSEFEVIVVNDDQQGQVLPALEREFSLVPFPEVYRDSLPCAHVKAVYASTAYPGLRLVDKYSGERADALNAGLNCARYPLFCNMDTSFILQRDSLRKMGRAFRRGEAVVATCASVGIANGSVLRGGFMGSTGLPRAWPALFQLVGHLRAARFAPVIWSRLNSLLLSAGSWGVFDKETVLAAGGYRTDAMAGDMELVVRLHRQLRQQDRPYHIAYVPDPLCWTPVPESWQGLKTRQMQRQGGLTQSLEMNRQMFLGRKCGAAGWLGFPFLLLFEWLGPWLETLGYVIMTLLWLSGLISATALWTFLLAAIGLGMLLSTSAVLLDEIMFSPGRKLMDTLRLLAAALLENLGYRQLTSFWRMIGMLR